VVEPVCEPSVSSLVSDVVDGPAVVLVIVVASVSVSVAGVPEQART